MNDKARVIELKEKIAANHRKVVEIVRRKKQEGKEIRHFLSISQGVSDPELN